MKIVETDNMCGDYPNERFINIPSMAETTAEAITALINSNLSGDRAPRYWKVVDNDYVLAPGFKP